MRTYLSPVFAAFATTAIITHIWTFIIALLGKGLFAGIVSLLLPFLAEIYWMLEMVEANNTYATITFIHLVMAGPLVLLMWRGK